MAKIRQGSQIPKTNKSVSATNFTAPIEFNLNDLSFSDEYDGALPLTAPSLGKTQADLVLMQELASIPQKMAFKIGEVAEMLGVKQYVLRYWETEFEALKPRKSKNNQRVYTKREVETGFLIKKLLYTDRFSIEGARAALKQLRTQVREERDWKAAAQDTMQVTDKVRNLIKEIRRLRSFFEA